MTEIKIPRDELVPVDQLKVDGKNPNKMTPAQKHIKKSRQE